MTVQNAGIQWIKVDMFGMFPSMMRDEDDRRWIPGYGMAMEEHGHYRSEQSKCDCGKTFASEEVWKVHQVTQLAISVLVAHGRNDKGQCFTCGNKNIVPYSLHLISALHEAGLRIVLDE